MSNNLVLYHGSKEIVNVPMYHKGKKNNDFGYGFYCTENIELAKEWSVASLEDGFVNKYLLDIEYLKVSNLNSSKYTILNWIAILLEHRLFNINSPIVRRARQYLIDNFSVNVDAFDVIIGYRADDSYFDYAFAFINNMITVDQLSRALRFGELGEQVVLKSEYAFTKIKFLGFEQVSHLVYFKEREKRENDAKNRYNKLLEEESDGLYIQDIIRGGIKNDDPRIPRILS